MTYFHGLDLGQASDFTAHAILRSRIQTSEAPLRRALDGKMVHRLVHAERYRGVPYPDVVRRVRGRVDEIGLQDHEHGLLPQEQVLVVDRTGVGAPVLDLIRESGLGVEDIVGIQITGGSVRTYGAGFIGVPKRDLVSTVARVAQEGRLLISSRLAAAKVLQAELRAFTVKITAAGNDTFEAARERDHDDLVLAVALALYVGEMVAGSVRGGVVEVNWR